MKSLTMVPRFIVSACLCGQAVRYDGRSQTSPFIQQLTAMGQGVPVCPECLGGLPVPRPPYELCPDGRVLSREGADCTRAFLDGAQKVLDLCLKEGITAAILKENSPSCGSRFVYDGSFSGKRIPGQGVTAALLRKNGIQVYNETEAEKSDIFTAPFEA